MTQPSETTAKLPLVPFERLGCCRLLRPLGSGASGAVYLAELEQQTPYAAPGTQVAVKVLHPALVADRETRRRLDREARIGLGLKHPAIVTTYEARLDDPVAPHLVLEYVDGRDLRALLRDLIRVPEAMLRPLGAAVARGLEAIHGAEALHRDLKPTNLLLTRDHQIKIGDLGAAYMLAPDSLSATGGFLGTPLYASPEQLAGRALGPASDLYSLGVVLYEAATGVQPFAAPDIHAILQRHRDHVPPRAGEVHPPLTELLEDLLEALLEKDPARRPASAAAVAEILELGEESPWWRERQCRGDAAGPRSVLRQVHVEMALPLVGRDRELDLVRGWYGEARAGDGRVVVLEGEAGVGKSRFVAELIASVAEQDPDARILYGSNPPVHTGGGPGAVTQAVLAHFGRDRLAADLRRHLAAAPGLVRPFTAHLVGGAAEPDAPGLDDGALHAAYCHLVTSLAATRPVVWIIDDLHFARADVRALLLSIARATSASRVLLVATTRPGDASEELAALGRLPSARSLRLDRLGRDAVLELVRAAAGDGVADNLGATIAERSDGNAFFALAMLRELEDRRDAGAPQAPKVPPALRDVLEVRLGPLDSDERMLLDVAAALGFAFDPDLVARVVGRGRLAVLQSLASIERRLGVVRGTANGFEFDHHLLHEWLYERTPPLLRAEYHALLARAFEDRCAARNEAMTGEAAAFLAQSYFAGGQPAEALRFALRALRHLRERFRNEEAIELGRRAIEHPATTDAALQCDLRLMLAHALSHAGRGHEAVALVREAIRIAADARDARRAADAELTLGTLSYVVSDLETSRVALLAALAAARARGDRATEALCARKVGLVFLALADFDGAVEQFDTAIAITREIEDRSGHAEALRSRARIPLLTGRYAEAEPLLAESLRICCAIGDRMGEANTSSALGYVHTRRGRQHEAVACYVRQRALVRAMGYRSGEAHAEINIAAASVRVGEYAEARACIQRGMTLASSIGDRLLGASTLHNLGTLEFHLGNLEAARHAFAESLDWLRAMGERRFEADAIVDVATVDLVEGRLDEAASGLELALTMARERKLAPEAARATYELGNLAFARRDLTRAAVLYEEAIAGMTALGEPGGLAAATAALARVRFHQGDPAARSLFEQARSTAPVRPTSSIGWLPEAYLVWRDGRPLDFEVDERARVDVRAETHAVLHRAGHDGHREAAERLLQHLSRHLGRDDAERFRRTHPAARLLDADGLPADLAPSTPGTT